MYASHVSFVLRISCFDVTRSLKEVQVGKLSLFARQVGEQQVVGEAGGRLGQELMMKYEPFQLGVFGSICTCICFAVIYTDTYLHWAPKTIYARTMSIPSLSLHVTLENYVYVFIWKNASTMR